MNAWNKIKDNIILETKDYFNNKKINVENIIDLFHSVLMVRIDDEPKLQGVSVQIPKALVDILDEDSTKNMQLLAFGTLVKFEPFLKKLIYILFPEKYNALKIEKKALAAVIKALKLNPNRIQYDDPSEFQKMSYYDYDYHLYKAYNLRNTESHDMQLWSNRELMENIESLLIFYLEVVSTYEELLRQILPTYNNDFSAYIDSIIEELDFNFNRYVFTDTIEDITVFENYVIENNQSNYFDEEQIERAGTVNFIRKNSLPEKRMLLWGEAGMGKSTTLQYLTYIDALDYKNRISDALPVYIPLGMLIDPNISLEQYICHILNIEYITFWEILKSGKLNIYLDGVNEIPAENTKSTNNLQVHNKRLIEIQNLLKENNKSLFIVSDRPNSYNYFEDIPVFRLQKMDFRKIRAFVEKNSPSQLVQDTIIKGVTDNENLLKLMGTPLMSARLIEIVHKLQMFPNSEGTIIKYYLESLYKREIVEKKDTFFNEIIVDTLLISLAEYGFNKNGGNSGISRNEVMECFADTMKKYSFDYDSVYVLNILLDLGVLSTNKEKEIYVFAHQAYQDYYLSKSSKYSASNNKEINKFIKFEDDKDKFIDSDLNNKDAEHNDTYLNETKNTEIKYENESDFDKYFSKFANNEKFEKNIIYNLHTDEKGLRNKKIKSLLKYNNYLAAKVISSGESDDSIEQLIVDKSINVLQNTTDANSCLRSILSLIELNKINDLNNNIHYVVKNKLIQTVARSLSGMQCVYFLNCLSKSEDVDRLTKNIHKIIAVFKLNDYEYIWTKENLKLIQELTENVVPKIAASKYVIDYYMTFNVPRSMLSPDIGSIVNDTAVSHLDDALGFINKYKLNIKINYTDVLKNYYSWAKSRKKNRSFVNTLIKNHVTPLPYKEREEIFVNLFKSSSVFRCDLFLANFNEEQKFCVVKNFDVYYALFYMSDHRKKLNEINILSNEELLQLLDFENINNKDSLLKIFVQDSTRPKFYLNSHKLCFADFLADKYNYAPYHNFISKHYEKEINYSESTRFTEILNTLFEKATIKDYRDCHKLVKSEKLSKKK